MLPTCHAGTETSVFARDFSAYSVSLEKLSEDVDQLCVLIMLQVAQLWQRDRATHAPGWVTLRPNFRFKSYVSRQ